MIFESHNQIKAHGSIKIYQKRSRIVGIVILTYMLTQAIKYKSIRKSVNHYFFIMRLPRSYATISLLVWD